MGKSVRFVVLAALVAASCGGSDDAAPSTTEASAAGTTAAPATTPPETSPPDTPAPTTAAPATTSAPIPEPTIAIPAVTPVEGTEGIIRSLANAALPEGWVEEEFFFGGDATSYARVGDDPWVAEPADTAPFQSRMIVRRPPDEDFSGTVFMEWFNVTAGTESSPDWGYLAEEIERAGHIYIGLSIQEVGVNGADGSRAGGLVDSRGLKVIDPERYGTLEHPGDAYAFDILSQAGAAAAGLSETNVLGGLEAETVIAAGESQSAIFLTTYINSVHPLTQVFDGFFVHSRGASAPAPSGTRDNGEEVAMIREDIGVPVFQYEAETDLTVLGFVAARQPDSQWVHTWEVAGTAHSDAYTLAVSAGAQRDAALGSLIGCEVGINDGPHHETLQAGLSHLVTWIQGGVTPPTSPLLEIDTSGESPAVVRDDLGLALGGIRTPPVDAPLRTLSGDPSGETGGFCGLFGQTLPLDAALLIERYGDVAGFTEAFDAAADAAVAEGWLLAADAATMREEEIARATELLGG